MQGDSVLYPPSILDNIWLFVSGFIIFSILLLLFILFKPKRKPKPSAKPDVKKTKKKYLNLIDRAEKNYKKDGDARTLYQQLSLLLRKFVFEVDGIESHRMTLEDLKKEKVDDLSSVIEKYYPSSFSIKVEDPASASNLAREVIRSWH